MLFFINTIIDVSHNINIVRVLFQVLIDSTNNWVRASNGNVPANAVAGGRTKSGETLYVGRV